MGRSVSINRFPFPTRRRTGSLRPTSGPSYMGKRPRSAAGDKHKRKPPRGMYINHDDIVTLAKNPSEESDQLLSSMDREVVALMSQVRIGVRARIEWE